MNISQFAISSFEGPFFMRIKISESNIVDDDILYKCISICLCCIPIYAYLHVNIWVLFWLYLLDFLGGDEIFFHYVEALKFLDGE
jgi:hypothetical protein